jgi:CheY-like chemotaxis protein
VTPIPTPSSTPSPTPSPSPSSTPNASKIASTPSPTPQQSTPQPEVLLEDNFGPESAGLWSKTSVSSGETITISANHRSQDEGIARFTTDGGSTGTEYAYLAKNIDTEEAYAKGEFLIIGTDHEQLLKEDGDTIYLMQFANGKNSIAKVGVRREAGVDKWTLEAGEVFKTASEVITGQWYIVELHYSPLQGGAKMFVDGQKILQINVTNTNLNIKEFDFGIISAIKTQDRIAIYAESAKLSMTCEALKGTIKENFWTNLIPTLSLVPIAILFAYFIKSTFKNSNGLSSRKKKTILVVDDDRMIRTTFEDFLQENGYDVDTVTTSNQAIQKMEAKDYEAAIIDITLPDMSGIELLQNIPRKNLGMLKIVMTDLPTKESGQLAADNGADEYLVKPINPQELLELLKNRFP